MSLVASLNIICIYYILYKNRGNIIKYSFIGICQISKVMYITSSKITKVTYITTGYFYGLKNNSRKYYLRFF